MDGSNIDILSSVDYFTILKSIAFNINRLSYNEEIFNEVYRKLNYDIKSHTLSLSLYKILNDLNISPDITIDNFYLLIRSISLIWLNEYQECLTEKPFCDYSYVIDKKRFISVFKQTYGDEYDSVLVEIIDRGRFYNRRFKL